MAISKSVSVLALGLLLAGCSQVIVSSRISIKREYASDEFTRGIRDAIFGKVNEIGGSCTLTNKRRMFYSCVIPAGTDVNVNFGFSQSGIYTIYIDSTRVLWLPPRKHDVVGGKYVSNLHKSLEVWVDKIVPKNAIADQRRDYIGYGYSEPL